MRILVALAVVVVTATSHPSPSAPPPPATDHFLVDAAVGGVVRRDLREIGKAVLQYVELPGAFRMRGNARVENRQKHKTYRFQIDMTFRTSGRRLEVLEDKSVFTGDAADVKERVQRVMPFLYLLRSLPVPTPAEEPTRSWLARHGYFVMRYARRETYVEATLHQDDELVGKFRVVPHPGKSNDLEVIEIPAAENVTVLFTRKTGP